MKSGTVFYDAVGGTHATPEQAQFINDRLVAAKIQQGLEFLVNDFRERLHREEHYIDLESCMVRIQNIYAESIASVRDVRPPAAEPPANSEG
jgi:hypothetical protein